MFKGKDRGKTGIVLRVAPKEARVVIEGLNLYIKKARPRTAETKGEMVSLPRPVPVGNVMVVCPNCKHPTRVGHMVTAERKSIRMCKKCKSSF